MVNEPVNAIQDLTSKVLALVDEWEGAGRLSPEEAAHARRAFPTADGATDRREGNGNGAKYRQLADMLPQHVFELDPKGYFTFSNRAGADSVGWTIEELVGHAHIVNLIVEEQRVRALHDFKVLKKGEKLSGINYTVVRKDGSTFEVSAYLAPLMNDGAFVGVRGVAVDISDLKAAQARLEQSNEELEQRVRTRAAQIIRQKDNLARILEAMEDGVHIVDREHRIQFVNEALVRELGPVNGRRCYEYFHDQSLPCRECHFDKVRTGRPTRFEWYCRKNGKTYELVDTLLVDADGEHTKLELFRDITERKTAEQALRQSEQQFRSVFHNSHDGIYIADQQGLIGAANPAMRNLLDITDEDMGLRDIYGFFLDPHAGRVFRHAVESLGEVRDYEAKLKGKYDREIECLITVSLRAASNGEMLGHEGTVKDVTERKAMERRLFEAEKMRAIGTLAGGIAHDFNNILFIISGCAELARDEAGEGTLLADHLSQIILAGERAKALVQQILTFSRQTGHAETVLSPGPIVKEVCKFLRCSLPSAIRIKTRIAEDMRPILVDPTHIHQILMNLCTNAAHAMGEHGGELSIELDETNLDGADLQGRPDTAPGTYARLKVKDTGHGIPKELVDRIFEPYFTTKAAGEGTGLGLSVVHGIVRANRGSIKVESVHGQGSTFRVCFPTTAPTTETEPLPAGEAAQGNERILLVDDEPAVARMLSKLLETLGYEVESKTSSADALDVFRADPNAFDLVVTDMTMPRINGLGLARELRCVRPEIPIILCTGFSEFVDEDQALACGIQALLMKPVLRPQMAEAVRKALDWARHV